MAFAAAAPSGAILGHGLGYAHGGLPLGYAAPLAVAHAAPVAVAHAVAPALPTISPGDIQGAAIDAHVEAADHVRASVDQAREAHDQHAELHGQAVNAAEDHSWQALDAVKTVEAQLDGAAAGAAPVLAKSLAAPAVYAGHAAYAAPAVYGGAHAAYAAAPALYAGHAAYAAAPAAYAAAPAVYGAHAAPVAYGAAFGGSKSVSTQSLSQTHPAPAHTYVAHAAPALGYAAHGLVAHGHGW